MSLAGTWCSLAFATTLAGCLEIPPPLGSVVDGSPGGIKFEKSWVGGSTGSTVQANVVGAMPGVYIAVVAANNNSSITGHVAASGDGFGLTWNYVATSPGDIVELDLWWAYAPNPSATATVTAPLLRSADSAALAVLLYSGVNATSPIGGIAADAVGGTELLLLAPATMPPSIVVGAFVGRHFDNVFVPGPGLDVRAQQDQVGSSEQSSANLTVVDVASTAPTTSVAGTLDHGAAAAVELRP